MPATPAPLLTPAEVLELHKIGLAMSHPTRAYLLATLAERSYERVGDLVEFSRSVLDWEVTQPTISRHLRFLHEADLIARWRTGQKVKVEITERGRLVLDSLLEASNLPRS